MLVIESMKMEMKVHALQEGIVKSISVTEGEVVGAGKKFLEIDPQPGLAAKL
jgi:biotin carboxyl carrier protein